MKFNALLVAATLAYCSSAAAGFDTLDIKTDFSCGYVLGIAVHDQRPTVLSGEAKESMIGGANGGGILFKRSYTYTNSEIPAAEAMAEGLSRSIYRDKCLGTAMLHAAATVKPEDVIAKIRKAKLRRTMLVSINQLWTESYRNTGVEYKLRVAVLDEEGRELAQTTLETNQTLREWGEDAVAIIFGQQLTEALKKPEFVSALKG